MFPILLEIPSFILFGLQFGPFTLHSYGFFVAAGFLLGIGWSMREARARGLNPDLLSDLGFYVILGAIIGARVLYALINPGYFWNNPGEILMFWKGGLVYSGGAILAAITAWAWLRFKKQDPWVWMDTLAPGIGLGEAVGRIGCLAAGCCYGAVCDLPWAMTFFHSESLAPLHVPLHPTQLYHSLAGLVCFGATVALKTRLRHTGQLMGIFLILFGAFRFVIELFRSDYRGDFGPISVTQLIAMAGIGLGIFIILHRRRHVR